MGFGLRDKDWVDPDDRPQRAACDRCEHGHVSPDLEWCYCSEDDTWMHGDDMDIGECSWFEEV